MKERIKVVVGEILCRLMPEKHQRLRKNFTIPSAAGDTHYGLSERLMRAFILQRELEKKSSTEEIHQDFWREQQPSQWYEETADRFESTHQPIIFPIAQTVLPWLERKSISRVVEFGCGNGTWLAHLKKHWPADKYIGVDISETQIDQCRDAYPDIQFSADDILAWMEANGADRSIYLTNCGVLEYLSQTSVASLYQMVAQTDNNLLFLVEPLADDYDLQEEFDSRIYGVEHSYAHNHPWLLERAGFQVIQLEELNILNTRMVVILAG